MIGFAARPGTDVLPMCSSLICSPAQARSMRSASAANSSGQVGPNLDDAKPGYDTVLQKVANGGGGMPSFGGQLSQQQIRDVAAFVAARAGSG